MLFAVCCDDDYKNVICLNRFINICCAAAVEDDAGAGKEYHTDVPELAVEEGPRHPRSEKATTTILHLFKRRMIDKGKKRLGPLLVVVI